MITLKLKENKENIQSASWDIIHLFLLFILFVCLLIYLFEIVLSGKLSFLWRILVLPSSAN